MGFMSDATTREQDAETFFQNTPRLYVTSAITDPHGTWSDRILGNNSSLMPVWAEQSRSLVTTPSGDLRFRRRDRVSGAALGGIWRRLYPRRECVVNSKLLRGGDGGGSVLLLWGFRGRDRAPGAGPGAPTTRSPAARARRRRTTVPSPHRGCAVGLPLSSGPSRASPPSGLAGAFQVAWLASGARCSPIAGALSSVDRTSCTWRSRVSLPWSSPSPARLRSVQLVRRDPLPERRHDHCRDGETCGPDVERAHEIPIPGLGDQDQDGLDRRVGGLLGHRRPPSVVAAGGTLRRLPARAGGPRRRRGRGCGPGAWRAPGRSVPP